jgi:hypothetical protein
MIAALDAACGLHPLENVLESGLLLAGIISQPHLAQTAANGKKAECLERRGSPRWANLSNRFYPGS